MNEKRRTLSQIILIIEKRFNGAKVKDICNKAGIDTTTFHRWERQYKGLVQEYMEIKKENERLRKMFTNLSVLHDTLHDTLNSVLKETNLTINHNSNNTETNKFSA